MQREMQIHELETALRVEEAKLLMMKKLKQSQQQAEKKQVCQNLWEWKTWKYLGAVVKLPFLFR